MSETQFAWQRRIRSETALLKLFGLSMTLVFAGGFAAWASFAPLQGAAVASGTVAAAGRNIQIQHLEGGILRQFMVREGDHVSRDQTVMVLDDTTARTEYQRLVKQAMILQTRIARLSAERDGRDAFEVSFTDEQQHFATEIASVLNEERKEFAARLARFQSERLILGQRVTRLNESLDGLKAQKKAVSDQIAVIEDEASRIKALLDRGLAVRSDHANLVRILADLLGQRGSLDAEIAGSATQIAEAQEQIERQMTQRIEEAVTRLNETRVAFADAEEKMRAAAAVLERTIIRSRVDGVVVNSIYNIAGNVISPGEKIMEILPTSETPLVEARLRPTDIDAVKKGQEARLRFVALNTRLTPEVGARVETVSADRLIDPATHEPYYRAVLRIDGELPPGLTVAELHPGMPVEAFIGTGERTFFEYLVKPISDSASRAFREE